MNLRYYLRGLGLGIIVTAVVMGIVVGGKNKTTMTDAEIKQKATELGMVDGNSRLVEDDKTAEDMLEELDNDNKEIDSAIAAADAFLNDETTDSEDILEPVTGEESTDEEATDDPDKKADVVLEDTTSDSYLDEPVAEDVVEPATDEVEENIVEESVEDAPAVENTGDTVTFVIKSGDSSYAVAKNLAAAGLVPNASDYDSYLCQYGYDRYIRTGTFQIASNASNEDIAKMITGR